MNTEDINKLEDEEYWDASLILVADRAKELEFQKKLKAFQAFQDKSVLLAKKYCSEFKKRDKELRNYLSSGLNHTEDLFVGNEFEWLFHDKGYGLFLQLDCKETPEFHLECPNCQATPIVEEWRVANEGIEVLGMKQLPERFESVDEFYDFRDNSGSRFDCPECGEVCCIEDMEIY